MQAFTPAKVLLFFGINKFSDINLQIARQFAVIC